MYNEWQIPKQLKHKDCYTEGRGKVNKDQVEPNEVGQIVTMEGQEPRTEAPSLVPYLQTTGTHAEKTHMADPQ